MAKHVLLIGHGYVGSEIARRLRLSGYQVTAVSRTAQPSMDVIASDVTSIEALRSLNIEPDHIIHCASSGRGGEEAYRAVFVEGVKNLQHLFPQANILFTSSSSVYAQTDGSTVTENSPTLPDRETGKILLEAEQLVLSKQGTVVRLSGIYGPKRSFILKKFLSNEASLEEDGRRILNQIHRDDAAASFLHFLSHPELVRGQVFNITDNTPTSQKETFEQLCQRFQRPMPDSKPRDLNRKRGWTHKAVSNQKALDTGWLPQYPNFIDASEAVAKSLDLL